MRFFWVQNFELLRHKKFMKMVKPEPERSIKIKNCNKTSKLNIYKLIFQDVARGLLYVFTTYKK